MSMKRKGNDVLRYRVYYSRGHQVGQVRGDEGPVWGSDWVKSVSPSYLYETRGPYRPTAYTWHFPYDAALWQVQTLALLPLNFFLLPKVPRWLTTDCAVSKMVGFVHWWWVHLSESTITTSSEALLKPGLRAEQSQETLLSFVWGNPFCQKGCCNWNSGFPSQIPLGITSPSLPTNKNPHILKGKSKQTFDFEK